MKTPMQDLIEQWEMMRDSSKHKQIYQVFIEDAKAMLDKEKEVICEFAEYTRKCGFLSDQRGLMTTEELYDETFNTKEK